MVHSIFQLILLYLYKLLLFTVMLSSGLYVNTDRVVYMGSKDYAVWRFKCLVTDTYLNALKQQIISQLCHTVPFSKQVRELADYREHLSLKHKMNYFAVQRLYFS